jgi:hypothetical protein
MDTNLAALAKEHGKILYTSDVRLGVQQERRSGTGRDEQYYVPGARQAGSLSYKNLLAVSLA